MGHAAAAGFLEAETNFRAARRYRRPVVLTKGPFQAKKKQKSKPTAKAWGMWDEFHIKLGPAWDVSELKITKGSRKGPKILELSLTGDRGQGTERTTRDDIMYI